MPLPLEIRGGLSSSFSLCPVRFGAGSGEDSIDLVTTRGASPCRVVLPAEADAFTVRRVRLHERAGGFHRWRVRLIDRDALPGLSSKGVSGEGTETFGYFEPTRYYEQVRVLHYEFEDSGTVGYCPVAGGDPVRVVTSRATRKGHLRLPRHGYVTMSGGGGWRVSVT